MNSKFDSPSIFQLVIRLDFLSRSWVIRSRSKFDSKSISWKKKRQFVCCLRIFPYSKTRLKIFVEVLVFFLSQHFKKVISMLVINVASLIKFNTYSFSILKSKNFMQNVIPFVIWMRSFEDTFYCIVNPFNLWWDTHFFS